MRKVIGYVGVDSGLMLLGDPCYLIDDVQGISKMTWSEFLLEHTPISDWPVWRIWPKNHRAACLAIVTNTGDGDGVYPVTAEFDAEGRVRKLTVSFR